MRVVSACPPFSRFFSHGQLRPDAHWPPPVAGQQICCCGSPPPAQVPMVPGTGQDRSAALAAAKVQEG